VRKGNMEAPNEAVVNAQLRGQRITPTKVKQSAAAIKIKIPGF
jgi:type II secretory pathway component PulF